MSSFTRYWKGFIAALAAVATLMGLGAVLHGGATAYASASSVKALELRTTAIEVSQSKVVEKLDSVSGKLDLAIDLLAPNRCAGK
jgi:hypothetical protein